MKKSIVFLIVIACAFLLCACGEKKEGSSDLAVSDVAGTWVDDLGDGTETITLREDMTYTKTIILTNPYVEMVTDDTYSLDGDTITINYSDYGMKSKYTVTISETTMTWDNGSAQIVYTKQ